MLEKCTIIVSGFVQGVTFRYSAREKARALGLTGFVRNEKDGAVRIEAEGERDRIKILIEWCKDGPAYAEVRDVRVAWGAAGGAYRDFAIAY